MESFIKNLARGAGKILKDGFRTKFKVDHKLGAWDIVTEYDLASEKFIIDRIKNKFPSHGILSEETGLTEGKSSNFWVIDPLDGTNAFTREIAQFCVCIAFVANNQIKYAAIFDPSQNELFFSADKKGSYVNSQRIRVSQRENLRFSFIGAHIPLSRMEQRRRIYPNFIRKGVFFFSFGAIALTAANVAAGRVDGIFTGGLHPWDYAAAGLILKEAGAKVTDFKGRAFKWNSPELVAANPVLHRELLRAIKK